MRLFVGSPRPDWITAARNWFAAPANVPLLIEIFDWAKLQERTWGDCIMFVEPDVQGIDGLSAVQIDFIVAFSTRVAMVEVKNLRDFRTASTSLIDALGQCSRHLKPLVRHLRQAVDDDAIRPLLFIPRLTSDEVDRLDRSQHQDVSLHHVTIAGGHGCAAQPVLPNGKPLYLPEALRSRLDEVVNPRNSRLTNNAQVVLHNLLVGPAGKAKEFVDVPHAVSFLRSAVSVPSIIQLRESHVHGCRPTESRLARQRLDQYGYVEVIGPPGVGKSEFVRELLYTDAVVQKIEPTVVRLDLEAGTTTVDFCHDILERLNRDVSGPRDERSLLADIFSHDACIWIRSYDPRALGVLQEIVTALLPKTSAAAARWIVESTVPSLPNREACVEIGPLSENQIYQMLERVPIGHPNHDANLVAVKSRGNPRLAKAHWQSPSLEPPERFVAGDFAWVQYQFSGFERIALNFVATLLSDAPLGVTLSTLLKVGARVFSGMPRSTVESAIEQVVEKLETAQLVAVNQFDGRLCGSLLANPEDVRFILINHLHSALLRFVIAETPNDLKNSWREKTTECFVDLAEHTGSLAEVTAALRLDDLWSFCRSSFRHTHRANVIAWLNSRIQDRTAASATDLYLERAVRLQHQMFTNPRVAIDLAAELGPPAPDSPKQQYVWQVLRGRANCYLVNGRCDVDRWWQDARQIQDPDLAAESLGYLARELQEEQRFEDAWTILQALLAAQDEYAPSARGMVFFHTLAFLNRTHRASQMPGLGGRPVLVGKIETIARDALKLALSLENITNIASTVFYYLRSRELVDPPQSPEQIDVYMEGLRFVERASPVRGPQAILTQGSLHRHFCLKTDPPLVWEDFAHHLDQALLYYQRVFRTAVLSQSRTHQLNAAAYAGTLCLRALKYADEPGSRAFIAEKGTVAAQMSEGVLSRYPTREAAGGDAHIWTNVRSTLPFLRLIVIADGEGTNQEDLAKHEKALTEVLSERIRAAQQMKPWDRPRPLADTIVDLERGLQFATSNATRRTAVMRAYQRLVLSFCQSALRFAQPDRTGKYPSSAKRLRDTAQRLMGFLDQAPPSR